MQFVFIICQFDGYQNILKLSCRPLAFTLFKVFKKQKEVWNQSSCFIFCMIFEEKYFSCYILLPDQILLSGCLYFVRYWAIRVLQFFVNKQPSCDVIHFEINLTFLIKSLFLTVFSYHVTCTFQSEYTLYSSLNVKELLARSRRNI